MCIERSFPAKCTAKRYFQPPCEIIGKVTLILLQLLNSQLDICVNDIFLELLPSKWILLASICLPTPEVQHPCITEVVTANRVQECHRLKFREGPISLSFSHLKVRFGLTYPLVGEMELASQQGCSAHLAFKFLCSQWKRTSTSRGQFILSQGADLRVNP